MDVSKKQKDERLCISFDMQCVHAAIAIVVIYTKNDRENGAFRRYGNADGIIFFSPEYYAFINAQKMNERFFSGVFFIAFDL